MNKQEEAFTLIEVIIAMVIMGIGFSIFVQGFIEVNDGLDNKLDYNYVSNWAQAKLNELEAGAELASHGSFKYRTKIYNWDTVISYINPQLKQVELVISWDGKNARKKYSLSRVLIKKD